MKSSARQKHRPSSLWEPTRRGQGLSFATSTNLPPQRGCPKNAASARASRPDPKSIVLVQLGPRRTNSASSLGETARDLEVPRCERRSHGRYEHRRRHRPQRRADRAVAARTRIARRDRTGEGNHLRAVWREHGRELRAAPAGGSFTSDQDPSSRRTRCRDTRDAGRDHRRARQDRTGAPGELRRAGRTRREALRGAE